MGSREYLGEFEQVVLWALLRRPGAAYGGSIHEEILAATGRDVSIPAVYVTLKRLEKKGLVRSSISALTEGARKTRNYQVEPAGVEALHRSRAVLEKLWAGIDPVTGSEVG